MIPYLPILFVNCIFSTILYNEGREPIAQQSSYIPFILPVTYLEAAMILHVSHKQDLLSHLLLTEDSYWRRRLLISCFCFSLAMILPDQP
uniref:Uncharacterized protein n=1 Tax=Manihot esculenta TaxID=3983 RepID=A0A2C9UG05_MANES